MSLSRGFIPGKTAQEIELSGRAADEIDRLFGWVAGGLALNLPARAFKTEAAA